MSKIELFKKTDFEFKGIDDDVLIKYLDDLAEEQKESHVCANCGCTVEEQGFSYFVKLDWQKEYSDQILCDLCAEAHLLKERIKYMLKYNKAVKFAKKRKWYIEVNDSEGNVEKFKIDNHFMSCVDVIRERMKSAGLEEYWIDVDDVNIKGCEVQLVTFLYFDDRDCDEKFNDIPAKNEKSFWISLKKPKFWLWG